MNKARKKYPLNMRVDEITRDSLTELAAFYEVSRAEVVRTLIAQAHANFKKRTVK